MSARMASSLAGKRLLLLGGTRISLEIVRAAHELGVEVGVADYNQVEDSPCKQVCSEHFEVDLLEPAEVANIVAEYGYDGILTGFSDMLLPYYAEACKIAGVPCYGTKEQFQLFTDKACYKKKCCEYGLSVTEGYDPDVLLSNPNAGKYPLLVKPTDNSGSRGISVCASPEDLQEAYEKASLSSRSNNVLVEEYVQAPEATVFWFFAEGNPLLLAVANRHMELVQKDTIKLPVGYTMPSKMTSDYIERISPRAMKMFRDLDLRNGMLFMQLFHDGDEYKIYDIGYRLTGSLEYKLVAACTGFNPMHELIRFALTGSVNAEKIERSVDPFFAGKYGYNVSFLMKPGTIDHFEGVEASLAASGVLDVVKAHVEGETIPDEARGELRQIVLRGFGVADDPDDCCFAMKGLRNAIRVVSDEGDDLLLSSLKDLSLKGRLL